MNRPTLKGLELGREVKIRILAYGELSPLKERFGNAKGLAEIHTVYVQVLKRPIMSPLACPPLLGLYCSHSNPIHFLHQSLRQGPPHNLAST